MKVRQILRPYDDSLQYLITPSKMWSQLLYQEASSGQGQEQHLLHLETGIEMK